MLALAQKASARYLSSNHQTVSTMLENNVIFTPYSLYSPYWIIIEGGPLEAMVAVNANSLYHQPNLMGFATTHQWTKAWDALYQTLGPNADVAMRAAVIPAENVPSLQEIQLSLKPVSEINAIASNIWLANDLSEGRLVCYMQPVVDRERRVSGFEAFARIAHADGEKVSGGAIMQASRALRLEYQVDRLMHIQAVQKFLQQQLEGIIFINFLTNFIHLPGTYLAGLSEAVDRYGLPPQSIVLDIPLASYLRDVPKLKSIADYCNDKGFLLAFGDVDTTDKLAELLADMRPAFVKLDAKMTATIQTAETQARVKDILQRAHGFGARIVAEGVENAEQFEAYRNAGLDFFQGYYFGAPTQTPTMQV